eukprot:584564-Hanusia_phi.AAC.2
MYGIDMNICCPVSGHYPTYSIPSIVGSRRDSSWGGYSTLPHQKRYFRGKGGVAIVVFFGARVQEALSRHVGRSVASSPSSAPPASSSAPRTPPPPPPLSALYTCPVSSSPSTAHAPYVRSVSRGA